ncbi:MAG: hypothetical protein H0W53_05625 [Acidobacteria bacterium]|nr:hypothetical protein [Acidobacteriota bacterium]
MRDVAAVERHGGVPAEPDVVNRVRLMSSKWPRRSCHRFGRPAHPPRRATHGSEDDRAGRNEHHAPRA